MIDEQALKRWQRFVRKLVRDYVREVGEPPPITMWVSDAANPRRARLVPGDAEDRLALKARFQEAVRVNASLYAAVGARLRRKDDTSELGDHFGLVVVAPFETVRFGAVLSPGRRGLDLGAWEDGTFEMGDSLDFVQQALRASHREARDA